MLLCFVCQANSFCHNKFVGKSTDRSLEGRLGRKDLKVVLDGKIHLQSRPGQKDKACKVTRRSSWKIGLEGRPGRSAWKIGLKGRPGRSAWRVGLEGRSGRSSWKVGLESRLGRPSWKDILDGRPGRSCALEACTDLNEEIP